MRRISRIKRPVDLLRTRSIAPKTSTYLCSACKHHASPFSTSALRTAQNKASLTEKFTDKLRKKIWGTDNPPGQKDPYGDASIFDRTKMREEEQRNNEEEAAKARIAKAKAVSVPRAKKPARVKNLGTYQPANTWDGLQYVGDPVRDPRDWEGEYELAAFAPRKVVTDSDKIIASLHRALVEIFALQEAGVPLSKISKDAPGQDLTLDVTFIDSPAGPKLKFADVAPSLEDIVMSLVPVANENAEKTNPTESEEDVAADRSDVDPLHPETEPAPVDETVEKSKSTETEEDIAAEQSAEDFMETKRVTVLYEDLIATWGPTWLQVSLDNPEIKFAVMKRLMQLTGIRIPDSQLKARTPQQVLKHLVVPPKPRKLVEALKEKEELMTLPNVSIHKRRLTAIDKQKRLGRWKIIKQELSRRDLPLT
ncbi:hypothetical protein BUE80_DR001643 [Diplocarpon rosae]|nr:hypothetical protein BUE80_DR001643 [Diplocarpon rosae]